ncbi:MAG: MBL fold metallo-hydrolase [Lachnospiraceae bacterium]|nr:MBL fold metallo-hydrolase [Lachnospiraceae bacterium]
MRVEISDRIEYIVSSESPLSSDVVFVKGDKATWIFDVGASDEAYEAISKAICEELLNLRRGVNIVISHFHEDHMGNLQKIMKHARDVQKSRESNSETSDESSMCKSVNLYVSRYTCKHCKADTIDEDFVTIVDEQVTVDDGVKIHIFPIPSTHSKGCLCLEVGDEIIFMGDSIFPSYKMIRDGESEMGTSYDLYEKNSEYRKQVKVYNVQHLKEQIDLLKMLLGTNVFLSHEKRPLVKKAIIVRFLESVYAKREKDNPFCYIGENSKCIF